ncbi:MAG: 4Fe-4S dicluster domain-containing protein, partial [Methylococcales bacterium]|nr:4Fe-4S dicluster domain-containing protein [Methylococcales bacterium]
MAKLPAITQFSVELLGEYGGAFSSEHGDGRARSWLNETFFGKGLYGLFCQLKHSFDPDNLFNPGNVVESGVMTENLRYGESYTVIPITEMIDFTADMGFHRAVEMCNGAAVCRKQTVDTMCPSFQVTREEEHSTRGRANALRAVLSGQLPPAEFTSGRMKEVMALCVSCKACKAECPSSVDMAKIKFEWLGHYHKANGTPLRNRLFGNIALISRLSSGFVAPLVNWGLGLGVVKWGREKGLGISKERKMPAFARVPFTKWFAERQGRTGDKGRVVLFNDTFNTYNDPHVSIAATEVLEAMGYEVLLSGHKCCGRPMISNGLVEPARAAAKETIDKLAPLAAAGLPIIGLEPSCLLTLRDEYFSLLPNDERVAMVAEKAVTLEEFVAQQAEAGGLDLHFSEETQDVLLHGHCHQKALVGTQPSHQTLNLPPNTTVTEVDSGCCGMAGAFGYEAEHVDVSLAMGERRLMPAIRQTGDDTVIVAAGTSC